MTTHHDDVAGIQAYLGAVALLAWIYFTASMGTEGLWVGAAMTYYSLWLTFLIERAA
ncbi:MAG: hypothetical protein WC343_10935 [Bacilli bacterium]|jgi:hypothetical protein